MGAATISGTVKVGSTSFGYAEFKSSNRGGGSRGISIWVQGQKGKTTYRKLDPNPHDSRAYNKNQSGFYVALAEAIGAYYNQSGSFPDNDHQVQLLEYGGTYRLQDCW